MKTFVQQNDGEEAAVVMDGDTVGILRPQTVTLEQFLKDFPQGGPIASHLEFEKITTGEA